MILQTKPYNLLTDSILMGEAEWLLSLYLEQFLCKNSPLPCGSCRVKGRQLAPLFMLGFKAIGTALEEELPMIKNYLDSSKNLPQGTLTRAIARLALDRGHHQKWGIAKPWKSDSIPTPVEGNKTTWKSPTEDLLKHNHHSAPISVFKLAKRKREE